MQAIHIKFIRFFVFMFLGAFAFQSGRADWFQELKKIDTQRDSLFREREPGFLIRPLSDKSLDIIGKHYAHEESLEGIEVFYKSIIRTAIMHPRTHFLEQPYIPMQIEDLAVCYIIHTATQILEANSITTVSELAKNLFLYFQRLLAYKETALQTFGIDKGLVSGVLDVLEKRYVTEADYESLLTSNFVRWYQDVIASYPKERNKYGIRMEDLPSPVRMVLEITFRDGLVATYGDKDDAKGKEILFTLNKGTKTLPSLVSPDVHKGEIVYYGTHIDLNLPLPSLQKVLEPIGAKATLKKENLAALYVKKVLPHYERLSAVSPSSDRVQTIKDRREALAISDIYKTFGYQKAVEMILSFENGLGTRLYLQGIEASSVEKQETLFNEALELLEHSSQSQHARVQEARNNLNKILHDCVGYLYSHVVAPENKLPLDKSISLLRKSVELLKKAKENGYPNVQQFLPYVENSLGVALAKRAEDSDFSHSKRVSLFEESLGLLKRATASKIENAQASLAIIFNNYGFYLTNYAIGTKTLSQDVVITILRKSIDLFKEAKSQKAASAEGNLAVAEHQLGVLLGEKGSG